MRFIFFWRWGEEEAGVVFETHEVQLPAETAVHIFSRGLGSLRSTIEIFTDSTNNTGGDHHADWHLKKQQKKLFTEQSCERERGLTHFWGSCLMQPSQNFILYLPAQPIWPSSGFTSGLFAVLIPSAHFMFIILLFTSSVFLILLQLLSVLHSHPDNYTEETWVYYLPDELPVPILLPVPIAILRYFGCSVLDWY